jgi:hypothetical protein
MGYLGWNLRWVDENNLFALEFLLAVQMNLFWLELKPHPPAVQKGSVSCAKSFHYPTQGIRLCYGFDGIFCYSIIALRRA